MNAIVKKFLQPGKVSFILGGQWGSEGKGAAAAWLARQTAEAGTAFWDVITTNAGAQAGHTSVHKGKTVVVNHLPTAAIIAAEYGISPLVYLNAGCIIDPDRLKQELETHPSLRVVIHPNAAIITNECREAEQDPDSTRTKIASTQKGVGEALARKIRRYPGQIMKNYGDPQLTPLMGVVDLNHRLQIGNSVLCEIPQGYGLSINSQFYPYTTSRNCTVGQALSDMDVHPSYAGETMLVLRSMPIRVGNIVDETGRELGHSGGHYADQRELDWRTLGLTPEITTVTKRVRRIFSFSKFQAMESMAASRPSVIFMTFCDYLGPERAEHWLGQLDLIAHNLGLHFDPVFGVGPSTDDVIFSLVHWGTAK